MFSLLFFTIKVLSANILHGIEQCSLVFKTIKQLGSQMAHTNDFVSVHLELMKIHYLFAEFDNPKLGEIQICVIGHLRSWSFYID